MNAAFHGYRLLARFAEIVPLSLVPRLSAAAGSVAVLDRPRARLVARNLRRVSGGQPSASQVRAAFASYVRYWLDALRLPVMPEHLMDELCEIEGLDRLTAAREHGKGAILAVPHVGNWDFAGAWLAGRGIPLCVVVEKIEPPRLRRWFEDFRSSLGMQVVVNDHEVGSRLMRALGRNEVVALLCDRDVDGTGTEIEFFGETTRLPRGAAVLALRSGASILPAAVYQDGPGHRIVIEAPLDVQRGGRMRDDVVRITADLTRRLESLIRRAPEQWHLFQPNWPSDR